MSRRHVSCPEFTSVTLYDYHLQGEDPCQGQNPILTLDPSKEKGTLTRAKRVRGKSFCSPPVCVSATWLIGVEGPRRQRRAPSAISGVLVWSKICFLHIVADFQTFWQLSDGRGMCCRVKLSSCWLMTALHSARQRHSAKWRPLHLFLKASLAALFCFFTEFAATSASVITESLFALCSTNKHTFRQVRRTHGTPGCRID